MFSYYGSKKRLAPLYPKPKYSLIIEPFCGAAAYSCLYPERDVKLYDIDKRLIMVWNYLIQATKDDILALPMFGPGQRVDQFGLSIPEMTFLGYMISASTRNPKKTATDRTTWTESSRARIAEFVPKCAHWEAQCLSFQDIPHYKASWFIDPPYEDKGKWYDNFLTAEMFQQLGHKIKTCWKGQRMACESTEASWGPFEPLSLLSGQTGNVISEGLWHIEG